MPPPPLPALLPIIAGGRGGPSIGDAYSTGSQNIRTMNRAGTSARLNILRAEGEEPNPTGWIGLEPYGTTAPRTNPRKGKSWNETVS